MGITISGAIGIDMGDKPISNVSIVNQASVVDKAYVDDLKIIATGTATFTATTNNINLTGIGIGVEVGDVIQISGAEDAKNNSEFTVEVITDANNIIVNQAHANKGSTKNVVNRSGDIGVTVKLLAKYYNAPSGLGQGWVNISGTRAIGTPYPNNTKRTIKVSVYGNMSITSYVMIGNINGNSYQFSDRADVNSAVISLQGFEIPPLSNSDNYSVSVNGGSLTIAIWSELR